MTKESGPQPPQTGPAADTDQAAGADHLTDAARLGARGQYRAALDIWYGRKSPESEAFDKAAAADYAALKSALTPEREAALNDLAAGKGSARGIIEVLRPVPRLLDIVSLPHTPRVLAIRELIQVSNFPKEWDGYLDKYWTLGQTVLWVATGDPWAVDQASNNSGRLGEIWGQNKAWAVNDALNLPREHVQQAANELRRRCLDGQLTLIDGQGRPIPAIAWLHLKIGLDEKKVPSVRHVGQSTTEPAYQNVVFLRVDVLREFPPDKERDDGQEAAVYAQSLLHERRKRVADWFNRRQERTAFGKRIWFSLTEIADEYARKPGSLAFDEKKRGRALDALRRSILAREFVDDHDRSRILSMHPSGLADFRFDPLGARHADLFDPIAQHLWIRHQDCVEWFNRHGLDLPFRLRRVDPLKDVAGPGVEQVSAVPPEVADSTKDVTVVPQTAEDRAEAGGDVQVPGRQRRLERPLGQNGRANTVTVAWDVIGLHEEWATSGIPPHWSEKETGNAVNTHLRKLIKQRKIDPNDYDYLKPNSEGKYEISPDSVDRALVRRRQRRA